MIWTVPFNIWSGKDADADSWRVRWFPSRGVPEYVRALRLIGLSVRGFDRLMPDIPPVFGPGDVNMVIKLFRFVGHSSESGLGNATTQATAFILSAGQCSAEPRVDTEVQIQPNRQIAPWAAGDLYTGMIPVFVAGFNGRKGFQKSWSRANAFAVQKNNEYYEWIALCIAPRANLPFDATQDAQRGLILQGTVTLSR